MPDWLTGGDGNVSWATLAINPDGSYSIVGRHTYGQEGDYTVKLVVRRNMRYLPNLRLFYYDGRLDYALAASADSVGGMEQEFSATLGTAHIRSSTVPQDLLPMTFLPRTTGRSSLFAETPRAVVL